jgi:glycosyltransferase involved in cell wall biosynthesis
MIAPFALDLTRLGVGPVRRGPRGIDRVEMAYARHFLANWPGECVGVLPTLWGVRCFERERSLRGLDALDDLWRESTDPTQDTSYQQTKLFLSGRLPMSPAPAQGLTPSFIDKADGFWRLVSATGFTFGRSIARTLPKGAVYLNVGQLQVFRPFMSWLGRRPDVLSVFMIHDLIPLELPDHHLPIGIRFHESILKNTMEFAKALIVPSDAVRGQVSRALAARRERIDLPIHVELLPVPSEFIGEPAIDPELMQFQYFIICGVIDSYKNHLMLLNVWRELASRLGDKTPKLVIAGSPGVTSQAVLDRIESDAAIRKHVILSSGLSTPALRRLIANARALLMPSLAEGFGLPVVEALSQGTPVLASDIAAHRESGRGGDVTFLPPGDAERWLAAIESLAKTATAADRAQPRRYEPKTWNDYFHGIEKFLSAMAAK